MSQEAFEPGSLVRLVKGFAKIERKSTSDNLPDVETAGSLLWDLTADQDAVGQLLESDLIAVVLSNLRVCMDNMAEDTTLSANVSVDRMMELCFGILANLYAFPAAASELVADKAVLLAILSILESTDDPPALSELCRMLISALSSAKGRSAWLPMLQCQQQILAHLMLLIQSTLHSQLLQRSLELVAALLHASTASAAEHPPSEPSLNQQLWTAGLADALSAVLGPAAAVPDAQPALETAEGTDPGGWDNEPNTAAAAAAAAAGDGSTLEEVEQRLYKKPEVLEALVGVLEQLALQPEGIDVAVEHMPQLPELLLQVLAACSAAGRHEVLELLLPVLVMCRTVLLPLLQQYQQLPSASQERSMAGQQQQGQHMQLQGLQYLICIAGVLQDCTSPDSLDALDAGWYLCAAATNGLWQQQQQQGAASAGRYVQQAQQQLQSRAVAHASSASMAVTCNLLEQLCRSLSLATVPETAIRYAEQCVRNIVQAIATVVEVRSTDQAEELAASTAHSGNDADPTVVGSMVGALLHVALILQTLQQTLQEQQGDEDDAAVGQQVAEVCLLQQDVAALQKLLPSVQSRVSLD